MPKTTKLLHQEKQIALRGNEELIFENCDEFILYVKNNHAVEDRLVFLESYLNKDYENRLISIMPKTEKELQNFLCLFHWKKRIEVFNILMKQPDSLPNDLRLVKFIFIFCQPFRAEIFHIVKLKKEIWLQDIVDLTEILNSLNEDEKTKVWDEIKDSIKTIQYDDMITILKLAPESERFNKLKLISEVYSNATYINLNDLISLFEIKNWIEVIKVFFRKSKIDTQTIDWSFLSKVERNRLQEICLYVNFLTPNTFITILRAFNPYCRMIILENEILIKLIPLLTKLVSLNVQEFVKILKCYEDCKVIDILSVITILRTKIKTNEKDESFIFFTSLKYLNKRHFKEECPEFLNIFLEEIVELNNANLISLLQSYHSYQRFSVFCHVINNMNIKISLLNESILVDILNLFFPKDRDQVLEFLKNNLMLSNVELRHIEFQIKNVSDRIYCLPQPDDTNKRLSCCDDITKITISGTKRPQISIEENCSPNRRSEEKLKI